MPRAPLLVEVALTPSLIPPTGPRDARVYVVIDVVRATTTLCAFFERGARRILLAPGIAEARETRTYLGETSLLAGEAAGARPAGFDLGNSPSELAAWDLRGREIVFATTNGTRALRACRDGRAAFAGAFRNAASVVRAALAAATNSPDPGSAPTPARVILVCSGRGDQPAFDDTLCAGYLVSRLRDVAREQGHDCILDGGAPIALSVWRDVERTGNLRDALALSGAGAAISSIGLSAVLAWCAAVDATTIVPTLTTDPRAHAADLLVVEPR